MRSMQRSLLAAFVLTACLSAFTLPAVFAEDKAPTTQESKPVNKICPVGGEEVDPAVTTTYEGKTIGFCCEKCVAKFNKTPEKYLKNLK